MISGSFRLPSAFFIAIALIFAHLLLFSSASVTHDERLSRPLDRMEFLKTLVGNSFQGTTRVASSYPSSSATWVDSDYAFFADDGSTQSQSDTIDLLYKSFHSASNGDTVLMGEGELKCTHLKPIFTDHYCGYGDGRFL